MQVNRGPPKILYAIKATILPVLDDGLSGESYERVLGSHRPLKVEIAKIKLICRAAFLVAIAKIESQNLRLGTH